MDAMAAMFARMIGMKPEEMQTLFTQMQSLVMSTAEKVAAIHEATKRLETKMEELENGRRDGNGGDIGTRSPRGRRANSGNSGPASE